MMELIQPYLSLLVVAAIVLAVLILAIVIYKMMNRNVRGRKGSRLGISEYYEIDKNRRLVLIRRDEVEHLVMVGGEQDLVIESGIGAPALAVAAEAPIAAQMRPAPRPPVFGNNRPPLRPIEPSFKPQE
jgi:flagellar biogenesis protein FliO